MTIVDSRRPITGGVDTHIDTHVAPRSTTNGGLLGVETFATEAPATPSSLPGWRLGSDGPVIGVEGTGSYGAGLARPPRREVSRGRG